MTEGTKYHPLFEHLLFSGQGHLPMTFAEVEAVISAPLPPSARRREEWWSNSPSGHSQARAWLRANYRTSNVDLAGGKVDFNLKGWPGSYRRANLSPHAVEGDHAGVGEAEQASYEPIEDEVRSPGAAGRDHPLFGIWQGKVTLLPGYDYTRPAFEPDTTP